MKTAWHWHKNRYEDQWNRIEDPDMNPHNFAHLIFKKGAKNIWWKIAFSTNVAGKSGYLCRKLKLGPCLSPCTSINSKWIKNLYIRPETFQLEQERAGNALEAIGIGETSSVEFQQSSN
jgi:hypothetical protein